MRGLVPNASAVHFDRKDVINNSWLNLPGLLGESLHIQDRPSNDSVWTDTAACHPRSLVWYRLQLSVSLKADPEGRFALDLQSMSKGVVWVNGVSLGSLLVEAGVDGRGGG